MSWLAPARYGFVLEGESYRLHQGLSGADLAAAAAGGEWTFLVPEGLVSGDRWRLLCRLVDPDDWVDVPHVYALALIVARQVYGVAWHVAVRLCGVAQTDWVTFHGWCLARGIEPRELTADRICAVVWAWIGDRLAWADSDQHKRARDEIWGPADNQLALVEAGIIFPPSEDDQERTRRELAAWGLPAPDSSDPTTYPE